MTKEGGWPGPCGPEVAEMANAILTLPRQSSLVALTGLRQARREIAKMWNCGTCRWFKVTPATEPRGQGICYRFPPTALAAASEAVGVHPAMVSAHPLVDGALCWCGEWTERPPGESHQQGWAPGP